MFYIIYDFAQVIKKFLTFSTYVFIYCYNLVQINSNRSYIYWIIVFSFSCQDSCCCTFALVDPWRRATSSMPLLTLRWSGTTSYRCTLAPSWSLPPAVRPAADDQNDRRASPPSLQAVRRPQPHTPSGRPGMFKRFASALFGDDAGQLSPGSGSGGGKEGEEEEEEEDWILINYLGNSYF